MANLTDYEYDIFLSHNHADQEWTTKLAERLEQEDWQGRKIKVFFSPWDIRPGQSIPQRIEQALPKSRKVGLILSPDAMKSAWVELERLVTTYITVSARDERLIPLYRRDCEIPALLQPILRIDFRDDSKFDESYGTLLSVIKDEPIPRRSRSRIHDSAILSPLIPRPPIVGFVARRDAEGRDIIARLKEELAPDKNNLIALSGPGGVGKSTLAAEAARALGESFGSRIVWTSALGRDDYSISTLLDDIATQLGHPEMRALPPSAKTEHVQALIASAPPLIVLDNFESIRDAERALCEDFLSNRATCPVLITSRQKIDSARNVTIPNMSLDESNVFLDRLIEQAINRSSFALFDRERVMRAAERNPLVMQWVMGQIDLAQDPDTVLDDLSHGEGDAAQRVFDRSFGLEQLGDDGRATLLALALFAPDASRTALAEVAGFGGDSKRLNESVKRLAGLYLAKSVAGSRLTVAGLTRELAKARLSREESAGEFRRRFVAHYLGYAEAHRRPMPENFDALEAAKDNVFTAVELAFELADFQSVMRLGGALSFDGVNGFLTVRGYWEEAIRFGHRALRAARSLSDDEPLVALFSHNLAITYQDRGELSEARRLYHESLTLSKKLGNQSHIASTLHQLGILAQNQGELAEARQLYHESLEIKNRLGNQPGIASTLNQLGIIAHTQGDLADARRLYHESLEIKKKLGNQSSVAITLHQLAMLAQDQGELAEARRLYHESLEINKKLGNQSRIANTLGQMALLAQAHSELKEARRLFHESLAIKKKLGNQRGIAIVLHNLAGMALDQGEWAEAGRLYHQSKEIAEKLGDQGGIASTLHELGRLAQAQGDLSAARRFYDESLEINRKLGNQDGIAMTLGQMGSLSEQEGDMSKAALLFREALEIFEKLGSPHADMTQRSLARVEGKSS